MPDIHYEICCDKKQLWTVFNIVLTGCPEKVHVLTITAEDEKTMFTGKKVAIIGGGKMGSILAHGMVARKILSAQNITVTDIDPARLADLRSSLKVQVTGDNKKAVKNANIIILAVKPQNFPETLTEIRPVVTQSKMFISIAAGVTTDFIEKALSKTPRVLRVMPNVAAMVGEGAAAVARGHFAKKDDVQYALAILNAVGLAVEVDEKFMNAVTGLSGSGPAYCFVIIEALTDAGVQLGLTRDLAEKLAAQTMLGSARLCLTGKQHPAQLKNMVTSPGGTTAVGLKVLEEGKIRSTLMAAVEAAAKKAKELAG
ncbi:MAG TPA: pyrroline-5-carboxylate reductase [Smithellaceae bacterium]|nr:pyrroline-5-carboxylate reductase [Smithellaceae bacterium]